MAEGVYQGRALRFYHIVLILAAGWMAGRLPSLVEAKSTEENRLIMALGEAGVKTSVPTDRSTLPPNSDREMAYLAADIAARVAAQVADQTVQNLLDAGWKPAHGQAAGLGTVSAQAQLPRETIVKIINQERSAPPSPVWSLPLPEPAAGYKKSEKPETGHPTSLSEPVSGGNAVALSEEDKEAHQLATQGYARLQVGERREAVDLLERAISKTSNEQDKARWASDVKSLKRRWNLAAYSLSRSGALTDPVAASPVLGGGQSGAAVGYMLNPLDETRVSVLGRITVAAKENGSVDNQTTEAALGLRVQPWRKVPVAIDVERRFALGVYARNAWAARISGGDRTQFNVAGMPLNLEGYGEAGVVGFPKQPALYAGGNLRTGRHVTTVGRVSIDAGAGLWSAVQRDYGNVASRVDAGPSARFRIEPWPFTAQFDYRVQAAGNAMPGTGPVITVAGEF